MEKTKQLFKKTFNIEQEITDSDYLNLICILNSFEGEVWIEGEGYTGFMSSASTLNLLKKDILSYCIDNKDILKDSVKMMFAKK